MDKKIIELNETEFNFIYLAAIHLKNEILRDNRPYYDPDSGSYISKKYSAKSSACEFSLLYFGEIIFKKYNSKNFILDFLERSVSVQLLVYLNGVIESINKSECIQLYNSDNHYTGKPLDFFLEKTNEKSINDKIEIKKLIKKLGV